MRRRLNVNDTSNISKRFKPEIKAKIKDWEKGFITLSELITELKRIDSEMSVEYMNLAIRISELRISELRVREEQERASEEAK